MLTQTAKTRLTMLRDALNDLNVSERLIMPAGKSPDKFEFRFSTFGRTEPTCQTLACAIGMAAMLPEFQAMGLGYTVVGNFFVFNERGETCDDGYSAAASFFDLTRKKSPTCSIRRSTPRAA